MAKFGLDGVVKVVAAYARSTGKGGRELEDVLDVFINSHFVVEKSLSYPPFCKDYYLLINDLTCRLSVENVFSKNEFSITGYYTEKV